MRTLTLIRHAKSSWDDIGLEDFDRPLNPRGQQNAALMGSRLRDNKVHIDLIVSSPALRAITTARLIATEIAYPPADIHGEELIYDSTVNALLTVVQSLPDKNASVALVGHNPGISGLAYYLSDQSILSFPTCAIAELQLQADSWCDVSAQSGEIKRYDYPKKNHR